MRAIVVSLVVMALVLSGCPSDDGDGSAFNSFTLSPGTYRFTPLSVDSNSCWQPALSFPPLVPVWFGADIAGQTVTITPPNPKIGNPLFGDLEGNAFDVAYLRDPFLVEGNCVLLISGDLGATLTGNDRFDATLSVTVSQQFNGGCDGLHRTTVGGSIIPFPDIISGPCEVSLSGVGRPL